MLANGKRLVQNGVVVLRKWIGITRALVCRDTDGRRLGQALFSETNGIPVLRLGISNSKIVAWSFQEGRWRRSENLDQSVPFWARPVNLSSRGINQREFFPASEYQAEAQWGVPAAGFQIGLRFQRSTYRVGDSIVAIIHARNMTNRAVKYQITTLAAKHGLLDFAVQDGKGQTVQSKAGDIAPFIMPLEKNVNVATQHVHWVRLDTQYEFEPGKYRISAKVGVPESNGACATAESGTSVIEVLPY